MGPPGVGKGTQAERLCDYFSIIHLSTGEILRNEINRKTELGIKAKQFMDLGKLVPDGLLLNMMENRLAQKDCVNGYILDGFPRTIRQAEGLEQLLDNHQQVLHGAISLFADEDAIIQRLILRGQSSGRSDDTPEVIKNRQHVYWQQTAPLLDFYRSKKQLFEVDGLGSIDIITHRIIDVLKKSLIN
jgi:adenylate kinase